MNVSTRFTVQGANHEDLVTKATEVWQQVTGEPGAKLPAWARIDVSPAIDIANVDGSPIVRVWDADVLVVARSMKPHGY